MVKRPRSLCCTSCFHGLVQNHLELQYYIYAENANIAALSPARAEYEFYSLKVKSNSPLSGEIILNEIMASNTSFKTDESGDYDDWIELYNTTDQDISCYGLYLSDNPSNKLKWEFYDTIIKAKSFLVVWADEDGTQSGLHANFKLSASGEAVILSDKDTAEIENVQFYAQQTDKGFARRPNGTGNFVIQNPSFKGWNLYFESWNLNESDVVESSGFFFVEPSNKSESFGTKVGFKF